MTEVSPKVPPIPSNEHFDIDVVKDGELSQAYENMLVMCPTINKYTCPKTVRKCSTMRKLDTTSLS